MMAGREINKGSSQACLVMAMIDAWLADDHPVLESLLDNVGGNYGEVFWNLNVVLGGTIQAIATDAGQPFEDMLQLVLPQFALRTDSDEAAEVARQALTAWSRGDDTIVEELNFDAELVRVGPQTVLLHFLAMLVAVSRSYANRSGCPFEDIRSGWAQSLGA